MQLYLLAQVRELAPEKWGTPKPYIVTLVEFPPEQLQWLLADTERLKGISPEQFERLIADRLQQMGLLTQITGRTNSKDGGITIWNWASIREKRGCPSKK